MGLRPTLAVRDSDRRRAAPKGGTISRGRLFRWRNQVVRVKRFRNLRTSTEIGCTWSPLRPLPLCVRGGGAGPGAGAGGGGRAAARGRGGARGGGAAAGAAAAGGRAGDARRPPGAK